MELYTTIELDTYQRLLMLVFNSKEKKLIKIISSSFKCFNQTSFLLL